MYLNLDINFIFVDISITMKLFRDSRACFETVNERGYGCFSPRFRFQKERVSLSPEMFSARTIFYRNDIVDCPRV